jgi:hypothetical protein
MENFYFQCDDKAWFRVRIRIRTETYVDPKTPVSQLLFSVAFENMALSKTYFES